METGGSPEFPGYPFEHMPRSQTPVVSRPLALAPTGLLPSTGWTSSALGPLTQTYPLTTTIHFSEFNVAACALAFPLLRTPPLDGRPSVRLSTCWLSLGRAGLFTRWVTLTIFKSVTLFHHPVFISARAPICYPACGARLGSEAFQESLCLTQCLFSARKKDVSHPVFVGRQLYAIPNFADKERTESAPICVLAGLQILPCSDNSFLEPLDAINYGLPLRVHRLLCGVG